MTKVVRDELTTSISNSIPKQTQKTIKIINKTRKLINLSHNQFGLSNYKEKLYRNFPNCRWLPTEESGPIKLMSGNHPDSGIISSGGGNIYIVGKGILFDSGGLDLKRGMLDMTNDKAGMLIALALSEIFPNKIRALCPISENLINTSLIVPGDILNIGEKEVKITNTDAEGRLILAEALSTLHPTKSDIIITIATLTGAVGYAIGAEATGVFAENNTLLRKYADASFEAKELAWALPLWGHYQTKYYNTKLIVNSTKDIKCGATEAALFVKQFIPYPERWIHLDIASSAFYKNGKANGVPIRSLINFIKKLQ
jgi:leucyl aminopeptidase